MRRKKDDKRVLRRGNGRDTKKHRRPTNIIKRNNGGSRNRNAHRNRNAYRSRNDNWNRNKQPKKRSRKTVLLVILVLVAFIIGAGIGVMMSFDSGNVEENNETHIENVTVEMTTHLNETEDVVFDESDAVDFNENQTSEILGAEDNPYYYDDGLEN